MSIKYSTSTEPSRLFSYSARDSKSVQKPSPLPVACTVPTLLLTPPVSDEEHESPSNRSNRVKSVAARDTASVPLMPILDGLSREEQINVLMQRKVMLEAYLRTLADGDRRDTSSNDGSSHDAVPITHDVYVQRVETASPSTARIHRIYKFPRIRRVRWSIKYLMRHRAQAVFAFLNTVRIAASGDQIPIFDGETDEEEEEDEVVFQPIRRSASPPATKHTETSENDYAAPSDSEIAELRKQLLQSQFAHLLRHEDVKTNKEQSLPVTPKVNHALISRHLRMPLMPATTRFGILEVKSRSRASSPTTRDQLLSDGEASISFVDLPVIIAPPPRPEILDRIEAVARSLQESFPMEAELLEPFIQNPLQGLSMVNIDTLAAGHGAVFWDNGVGKLHLDEEVRQTIPAGDVHIFMDHSNVFLSLIATLRENPPSDLPRRARKVLSLPVLSLILQRGRAVAPRGMHLAGSSPLMQSFDPAIRLGWECSVLKRVPAGGVMHDLKRGAIDDGSPRIKHMLEMKDPEEEKTVSRDFAVRRPGLISLPRSLLSTVLATATSEYDTVSSSDTENRPVSNTTIVQSTQYTKHRAYAGRQNNDSDGYNPHRMKEQAVDELLHLKILQTILGHRGKRPGTIVLATGDARGGQYNEQGFLGCVREAISRGWNVELWAFQNGMSRSWLDCARREGWTKTGRFAV
ncbi:hypothetical protein QFC20_005669 [Naganishia adeliensis]|uniref:Uncharacterized protein n=1 Tax=Naganishia adeliensis TaxID=92952 RepID=A0ACC2VKJ6_9TREE|nr:hypothetical protein QFC20_005669 [Naganishia adeliensis]